MKGKEIDLSFEFLDKKINKSNQKNKKCFETTILETISVQLNAMIVYCIFSFLMLKFFSVDFTLLSFVFLKLTLTMNAISQSFKYLKTKELKNQLANGITNLMFLWFVFYDNGFQKLLSFCFDYFKSFL